MPIPCVTKSTRHARHPALPRNKREVTRHVNHRRHGMHGKRTRTARHSNSCEPGRHMHTETHQTAIDATHHAQKTRTACAPNTTRDANAIWFTSIKISATKKKKWNASPAKRERSRTGFLLLQASRHPQSGTLGLLMPLTPPQRGFQPLGLLARLAGGF